MKRRTRIRWISYTLAMFVVLFTAVAACHVGADGYTTRIDAQSTRAFGEALSAIERLDRSLRKSTLAVGAPMENAICTEIYSDAQSAETALSALPVEMDALEQISRHISLVGDYAFSLSRAAAQGETFSDETMERLSGFSKTTQTLFEQLSKLREAYQSGAVAPEHYKRLTDALDNLEEKAEQAADTLNSEMHSLASEFPTAAQMVYDGIYSDHSGDAARLLEGKGEVSEEDAKTRAAEFLGIKPDALKPLGRTAAEIPCWRFSVPGEGDSASIAVTVQGGAIQRYLASCDAEGEADHEQAVKIGKTFLSDHGYSEMEPVETASGDGTETIVFVPAQEGVLLLPDRITMKICPETGKVVSFDATGYLKHHADRDLSPFQTREELRAALPEGVEVTKEQNAILQSPGGLERCCRMFACKTADGQKVTICVNAETGMQERILLEGERQQTIN